MEEENTSGRKRSVSAKGHSTRSLGRAEGRTPLSNSAGETASPRGSRANPAVPQAVLSAVAAIGQADRAAFSSRDVRSKLVASSPPLDSPLSSSSSSSLSAPSPSSGGGGPSPGSAGSRGNGLTDLPIRSPRSNLRSSRSESEGSLPSRSSSPSASPRGRLTSSPRGSEPGSGSSPQSSPRDRSSSSPRERSSSASPRSLATTAVLRSSSSPSSTGREAASSPRGKIRMRSTRSSSGGSTDGGGGGSSARKRSATAKKKSRDTADERRRKRERDIMGAEAQALTKKINQSVISLLNNVSELDYSEVMKLRTSVREWTGEVDRVLERMRKEFFVTPT